MRTTRRLVEQLLQEAKEVAAHAGTTLTRLIEDALREALARRREGAARKRVALPTFKGKGLQPGVDLGDSAALLDLMEGRRAAP